MTNSADENTEQSAAFVLSEIRTYAYLLASAKREVSAAQNTGLTPLEQLIKSMNAVVFIAFFVEAFFNHIGALKIKRWELLERKLAPKEKLQIIADEIRFDLDFSRNPCQSLAKVFEARNLIAHGKTQSHEHKFNENFELEPTFSIQANWESSCTPKNVHKLLLEMEKLTKEIYIKAGFEEELFSSFTVGSLHINHS